MRFLNIAIIEWMYLCCTILIIVITHPEILDFVGTSGEMAFHTLYEGPRRQRQKMDLQHKEKVPENLKETMMQFHIHDAALAKINMHSEEAISYDHLLDEQSKVLLENVFGLDRESGNMVREAIKFIDLELDKSDVVLEQVKRKFRRKQEEYNRYLRDLLVRHEDSKQTMKNAWLLLVIPILYALRVVPFRKNIVKLLAPLRKYSGEWSRSLKRSLQRLDRSINSAEETKVQSDSRKSHGIDLFKFRSTSVPVVSALHEGLTCCVCLVNPPQVVLVPCGHMNICDPCAREWKKKRPVGEGKECGGGCPTCRRKIKKIQVFVPL